MKSNDYLVTIIAISILVSFLSPKSAYAYLDPGTGSYLFQIIIAFLAGSIFAIKLYWTKIKTYFTNFSSKKVDKTDV